MFAINFVAAYTGKTFRLFC